MVMLPAIAAAADKPLLSAEDMPVHAVAAAPETHVPFRLKPGKYQTVTLDAEAGDITTDDHPEIVTGVPYGHNQVALYPHKPGAAHITIRDKRGAPIMSRYVVVADPEVKYIRLAKGDKTSVYYCPNMCYETHIVVPPKTAAK
jgi:hypothetical protein